LHNRGDWVKISFVRSILSIRIKSGFTYVKYGYSIEQSRGIGALDSILNHRVGKNFFSVSRLLLLVLLAVHSFGAMSSEVLAGSFPPFIDVTQPVRIQPEGLTFGNIIWGDSLSRCAAKYVWYARSYVR